MAKYGQIWPNMTKYDQIFPKWPNMAKYGQIFPKIAKYGQIW